MEPRTPELSPVPVRLAIVLSHPTQYYSPWFRWLVAHQWTLTVFYLWDFGIQQRHDAGFGTSVRWDVDLLSGYRSEFVPNTARTPGTSSFSGLVNPSLAAGLRAWRPDAVLAFGYGWRSLAQLALTWRDCPLILRGDSHSLGRRGHAALRRIPQQWLTRILLRRYRAFASVGVAHRRFLLAHGVPEDRIFLVPHCVDNDRWAAGAATARKAGNSLRAELGIPADHRVLLFAGKFEAKKRPDLVIEAFRRAGLPRTTLLMVGDGVLREKLRAEAAHLPSICWLPFTNQLAMPSVLATADLVILPSQGHGETWGLIVNEAMACGVPCIVSTDVGCREDLITDHVTGWSFPSGDVTALALRLHEALAELSTCPERIRAAIARRIAAYSYPVAATGLRELLAATVLTPF